MIITLLRELGWTKSQTPCEWSIGVSYAQWYFLLSRSIHNHEWVDVHKYPSKQAHSFDCCTYAAKKQKQKPSSFCMCMEMDVWNHPSLNLWTNLKVGKLCTERNFLLWHLFYPFNRLHAQSNWSQFLFVYNLTWWIDHMNMMLFAYAPGVWFVSIE